MITQELLDKIENAPIVFGLRAQGKLDAVRQARAAGKSWEQVGKLIGWEPRAAALHFRWANHAPLPAESELDAAHAIGCIAGIPVDKVAADLGGKRPETAKGIAAGLALYGMNLEPPKLVKIARGKPYPKKPGIVKVIASPSYRTLEFHWAAWDGREFFDPPEKKPRSWIGGIATAILFVRQ